MSQLHHPNIVAVTDLGQVGRQFYLAMEYVHGTDLFNVLRALHKANVQMPVEAAAFIVREVLAGLHHAHHRRGTDGRPLGIVHRDVSPQNVLLSYEGDVKLIDFGIAKAEERLTSTSSGIIKGKFHYMSPEQARGRPLDVRTDVFSAGILLYEALTASPVYEGDDGETLLSQVREADIPAPSALRPDLPHVLEGIAMKALSTDPEDRFQSAAEFHRALSAFLATRAVEFTRLDLAAFVSELLLGTQAQEIVGPFAEHDRQFPGEVLPLAGRTDRREAAEQRTTRDRWLRGTLGAVAVAIALAVAAIAWLTSTL
jgi:serine/threonine-protein kinase